MASCKHHDARVHWINQIDMRRPAAGAELRSPGENCISEPPRKRRMEETSAYASNTESRPEQLGMRRFVVFSCIVFEGLLCGRRGVYQIVTRVAEFQKRAERCRDGALRLYVSNGMFVLDADEHLLADMLPFAKHCRADVTSHQRSVTQMRIASSCRYDPIWKALQGRCHFAPASCCR